MSMEITEAASPAPTRQVAVAEKPKSISKKVRVAIDALVAGDVNTVTVAAEKAGPSYENLSRELGRPHVAEHLDRKVKRSLAVATARAGASKIELLDSPNEMVRDRASSFVTFSFTGRSQLSSTDAPSTTHFSEALLDLLSGIVIGEVPLDGLDLLGGGACLWHRCHLHFVSRSPAQVGSFSCAISMAVPSYWSQEGSAAVIGIAIEL
jgi:hypothetical protein